MLGFGLVLAAPCVAVQDPERAFVELLGDRTVAFVHEPVELTLRFGIETSFLDENLLQLFRRKLHVPVQLRAESWRRPPGATTVPTRSTSAGPFRSVALDHAILDAELMGTVVRDGRPFTVFALRHVVAAREQGSLLLSAPSLSFAYATRFRDDFVSGRVPEDRRDVVITGEPLEIEILPLPDEGRPPASWGLVGLFSVSASIEPSQLMLGDRARLGLTVLAAGPADLLALEPPRLDGLYGFQVHGLVDDVRRTDEQGDRRTMTYDVTLTADVPRVPAIPFASFDPGPPPRWVDGRTEPLRIEVLLPAGAEAGAAGPVPASGPGPGPDPGPGHAAPDADGGAPRGDEIGEGELPPGVLGVGALLLALLAWLARGRGDGPATEERVTLTRARVAAAAAAVLRGVPLATASTTAVPAPGPAPGAAPGAHPAGDPLPVLTAFLSACLDRPAAAVMAPDLRPRLCGVGVPEELAARAAGLLDRLAAPRYGGPAPADGGRPELVVLVGEFDAWARGEG